MKQFQYSNLNVVELNEFIRKDTKNYKDLSNSLCGKAYNLETTILPEDKNTIDIISNQINFEEANFKRKIDELKNTKIEGGLLSKLGQKKKIAKEIQDLESKHKNSIRVLNDKLKKQRELYEQHRILLQGILLRLEEKGIVWAEIRKLMEEKMRQGIFSLYQANSSSKSKNVKPADNDFMKRPLDREKGGSGSSNGNLSKNLLSDPNFYQLKNLSPAEQAEFIKFLKRYDFNSDKIRNLEQLDAARRFRMGLFADDKFKDYKNLAMGTSDYSIIDNIFGMFNGKNNSAPRPFNKSMCNHFPPTILDSHLNPRFLPNNNFDKFQQISNGPVFPYRNIFDRNIPNGNVPNINIPNNNLGNRNFRQPMNFNAMGRNLTDFRRRFENINDGGMRKFTYPQNRQAIFNTLQSFKEKIGNAPRIIHSNDRINNNEPSNVGFKNKSINDMDSQQIRSLSKKIMIDSGYGISGIEKGLNPLTKELSCALKDKNFQNLIVKSFDETKNRIPIEKDSYTKNVTSIVKEKTLQNQKNNELAELQKMLQKSGPNEK